MEPISLGSLPDDLLLDIVEQLRTAHDAASLSASSRRTQAFMLQRGWRTFVKARFPTLDIPSNETTQWNRLADRLTYLNRCWDKRGIFLNFFTEQGQPRHGRRARLGGQSVPFHPVVHARLLESLDDELVAWGVGEDLVVRRRSGEGKPADEWNRIRGQSGGYAAGSGDVTAVAVVERHHQPQVVVGRAMGNLELLSLDKDTFGQQAQSLTLHHPSGVSPGKQAVTWVDWQDHNSLLASCRGSQLMLYDVADSHRRELDPVALLDASEQASTGTPGNEDPFLRCARFLSGDVVACALGGSRNPLRWIKIQPTGFTPLHGAATHRDASEDVKKTTVRAIHPVAPGYNETLLLSAWDDGSYRLFDSRTPSYADAVYRDRFQPYQAGSSLLVYGRERFVAGSNHSPDLRLFDFRHPKSYHHFDGLSCPDALPCPSVGGQGQAPTAAAGVPERCDDQRGAACSWHARMRQDDWRPDATLHIGSYSIYDRVFCLAKASDASSTFYCGLQGAVVEANLMLGEHATSENTKRTVPPGWEVGPVQGRISLQETGVARCKDGELAHDGIIGIQRLWHQKHHRHPQNCLFRPSAHNPLDSSFYNT
ncbi:hypothetical protein S40285_07982 [Stachybotrys chlorohalonatus IBT 40285]|uniref:F-box domain-containing protein n=1 Tax=Stachybotrys chlorohalonatus (strain IBT 40285) TaxID=1283841 RepID=A0A084QJH1_STAC4|nr:hypothetical protein S40285_07982 [Stachybotrys chlorohalonata IBT 40285]